MIAPDPKTFYNTVMPGKLGSDYENARWRANPLLAAQYRMMTDVLGRLVAPAARSARRVLEVGPGPGTWTKLLLESNPGAQYTLMDVSREMLAQVRAELSSRKNVAFVESDLAAFEPSEPFDFFFSSRAIEYMPDKRTAARKIALLLVPGSRGALITKMPKPFFDRIKGRSISTLHTGQVLPRDLARVLEQSGCVVEKVRIATATLPGFGSAHANSIVYMLLKHLPLFFPFTLFAESYLVTFRKPL